MTDDPWMAEVTTEMRRTAAAIAPTPEAGAVVRERTVRLRRRRAVSAGAGTAALVVLVGLGLPALVADRSRPDDQPSPGPADTSPSTDSSTFTCPQGLDGLGDPPPIPDLADQQRVIDQLAQLSSIQVRHAEATALGVIALVDDDSGDLDYWADPSIAERLSRLGVAHTYEWRPESGSGDEASDQVRQVVLWELYPVLREVRQTVRGLPGVGGLAFWPDAGAVVVQWKAPIPREVSALAGTRANGARVEVRPTVYSRAEIRHAQDRLQEWLRDTARRDQWSSAGACADGSGLVVEMQPPVAGEPGLADDIAAAVGVPVFVIAERRGAAL